MSRTYRQRKPGYRVIENWYKYQEDKRIGNGSWKPAVIKSDNSSSRVKSRIAAQQGEETYQKHHKEL